MAEQRSPPSAAASIYPNLKTGTPEVVERQRTATSVADARSDVAGAMWPAQTKEARAAQAWRKRDHDTTLRLLRHANANVDARSQREGKR